MHTPSTPISLPETLRPVGFDLRSLSGRYESLGRSLPI